MSDYIWTICFLVSEISCKQVTNCTETGGKCKSLKKRGILCECGDAIEYDKILGCKGKDNLDFKFPLTCLEKFEICFQLIKTKTIISFHLRYYLLADCS